MEESRREPNPVKVSSDEALVKAEQLAPLEERATATKTSYHQGSITFNTDNIKLPREFTERREEKSGLFHLEPITISILIFCLAFIAVMAYLISIEPPKTKDEPPRVVEQKP